jgi:hypothetical protein
LPQTEQRYNETYGAMLVEVTSTTIEFSFYSIDWALIDSYTLGED